MKYFVVIVCLAGITVFFESCKRSGGRSDITKFPSIPGTWELKQAQNGMIPTKDYAPGNGNIFRFSDSGYEKYTNGNLTKKGQYIIINDSSVTAEVGLVIPSGEFTNRIIFDGDLTAPKTFFQVSNNSLIFLSGFFPLDGGSRVLYEKKEDHR